MSWDAKTTSISVIIRNKTCFRFNFFCFYLHTHSILYRFSVDFYSFFAIQISALLSRDNKKMFPRGNICHVLYPVNWRFSIVTKQFFSIRHVYSVSAIVMVFFAFFHSPCSCSPYEISSFTWKWHNRTPVTYTCCIRNQ